MEHLRQLPPAEKIPLLAALLCTLGVVITEAIGLAGILDSDIANLISLPLLGTAALLGGIQNLYRSQTVKSVFATAIFDFVAAVIIYIGCIIALAVYLTA